MENGQLRIVKTPHGDIVRLLTELVTELRIENQNLREALMNQRSLICGSVPSQPKDNG